MGKEITITFDTSYLNKLMEERKITQTDIAKGTGISRKTLYTAIVKGKASHRTIDLIAEYLDVHPNKLKEKEGENNNMNAQRRKMIQKALGLVTEARNLLEEALEEEREAFDNMPESLQSSERGEQMEENISNIEEAIGSLEEVEGLEDMI